MTNQNTPIQNFTRDIFFIESSHVQIQLVAQKIVKICLYLIIIVVRVDSVVKDVVVFAQDESVVQRQDVFDAGQDKRVVAAGHAPVSRRGFRSRDFDFLNIWQVIDLDNVVKVAKLVLDEGDFRIVTPEPVDGVPEVFFTLQKFVPHTKLYFIDTVYMHFVCCQTKWVRVLLQLQQKVNKMS